MRSSSLLGVALVGLVLVGGCGTQFNAGDTTEPRPTFAPDEQLDPPAQVPFAITIPKIGAHSTLEPLGLNPDRSLEVPAPDAPEQAGYYAGENTNELGDECLPGETCSAVVVAHVDGYGPDGEKGFPGVFAHLSELAPGDEVIVEQADGVQLRFVVEQVQQVPKAEFPTAEFYERVDQPRLNLATCGGAFGNAQPGHYDDNVLVWTVLAA